MIIENTKPKLQQISNYNISNKKKNILARELNKASRWIENT